MNLCTSPLHHIQCAVVRRGRRRRTRGGFTTGSTTVDSTSAPPVTSPLPHHPSWGVNSSEEDAHRKETVRERQLQNHHSNLRRPHRPSHLQKGYLELPVS